MRTTPSFRTAALVTSLMASASLPAAAQDAAEASRLDATQSGLARLRQHYDSLPRSAQARVSGGLKNAVAVARHFDRLRARLSMAPMTRAFPRNVEALSPLAPANTGLTLGKVSDPRRDNLFSNAVGFTQNSTSTAWCGSNIVVAYNDTGSLMETFGLAGAKSSVGYSRSTNKGVTFSDLGFVPGGTDLFDILVGSPVVVCGDANTFYVSGLLETTQDPPNPARVAVSSSVNAGASWSDPVAAVAKDDSTHLLDDAWLAVDPSNSSRLYVTYMDFDSSGAVCGTTASPITRLAVEIAASTDAGATWSTPVSVAESCDPDGTGGGRVAVDRTGAVYVAYLSVPSASAPSIQLKKSTDGGASFGAATVAAPLSVPGFVDGNSGELLLQGRFRVNPAPSLVVDTTTGKPTSGFVYVSWSDGTIPFINVFSLPEYSFSDVKLVRSTDGGGTFSAAVRVNSSVEPIPAPSLLAGRGTDQWSPAMAVESKTGALGVCWYDRRNDPSNFKIDRYCAKSTTGGATFTANVRKTTKNFAAVHAQEADTLDEFDMGDHDTLASDFLGTNVGFRGAYGDNSLGNADVKLTTY